MKKLISCLMVLCLVVGTAVTVTGCKKLGEAADNAIKKGCEAHDENK